MINNMCASNLGDQLEQGIKIARKRMLQEKALHNQDVIMSDRKGGIIRMPAKEALVKYEKYLQVDD